MERCYQAIQALLDRDELVDAQLGPGPPTQLCLVTHAAGVVAIVAALLQKRIQDVEPASPCGIYKLAQAEDGRWHPVVQNYTGHMSEMGRTKAWPLKVGGYDEFGQQILDHGDSPPWPVV